MGTKISDLPAASAVAGANLLPIVQSGVTNKATITQLFTSPALVTPALGTPSSGVATNLTGTAAGLTAGNVTTNANLTGPVTSVGNATTIVGPIDAVIIGASTAAAGSFTQANVSSKILVGGPTSSAGAFGLQIFGDASTLASSTVIRGYSNTVAGANIYMTKTRGTTATSTDAVQSGDTLGGVSFLGSDGTANQTRATVSGYVDGAVSAGTVPTALAFATGTTVNTTRAVISSAGLMGIGTTTPASSAIVDVTSTTLGFKFPVMTTTQKNAIVSPVAGLVIFDSTLAKLCVYSGSAWQTITSV